MILLTLIEQTVLTKYLTQDYFCLLTEELIQQQFLIVKRYKSAVQPIFLWEGKRPWLVVEILKDPVNFAPFSNIAEYDNVHKDWCNLIFEGFAV